MSRGPSRIWRTALVGGYVSLAVALTQAGPAVAESLQDEWFRQHQEAFADYQDSMKVFRHDRNCESDGLIGAMKASFKMHEVGIARLNYSGFRDTRDVRAGLDMLLDLADLSVRFDCLSIANTLYRSALNFGTDLSGVTIRAQSGIDQVARAQQAKIGR